MMRPILSAFLVVLAVTYHSPSLAFFSALRQLSHFDATMKFQEVSSSSTEKAKQGDISGGKKDLLIALEKYKYRTDLLISYCDYLQIIEEFNELRACTEKAFKKLKVITKRKTPDGKNLSADKEFFSDSDVVSYYKSLESTGLGIPDVYLFMQIQQLLGARLALGDVKGARDLLEFAKGLHFSPQEISELYGMFFLFATGTSATKEDLASIWKDYQQARQTAIIGSKDHIAYNLELTYLDSQQDTKGLKRSIAELEALNGTDVLRLSLRHSFDQTFSFVGQHRDATYEAIRDLDEKSRNIISQADGFQTKFFYLADAYRALGQYQKAYDFSLKGLEQARLIDQEDDAIIKRASEYLRQNNAQLDQGSVPKFNAVGPALSQVARHALLAGDVKSARTHYAESKSLDLIGEYVLEIIEFEGKLLVAEGKTKEAINHYKSFIETLEIRRQHIASEAAKIEFSAGAKNLYDELIQLFIKTGDFKAAFEYADRAKSRALLDLIQQRGLSEILASGDYPQSINKLLEELKFAEYGIRSTHLRGDDIVGSPAVDTYRGIIQKIDEESPRLANVLRAAHATAAEVQSALAPNTTFVLFYGNQTQLYAFVVDKDVVKVASLKASALASVNGYRRAIKNTEEKNVKALGTALHADLIAPLGLKAGTNLIIVPHGQLHYLPFGALPDKAGKIMAQSHTIRVLPSASLLLEQQNSKSISLADSKILLVGNPDLGDRSYDLQGAELEAESISALFKGRSTILLKQEAKKSAAIEHLRTNDILHFAMHGIFDPNDPLASGLAFAADSPTPGEPLKGLLSVEELYGLQTNANLVVLSACDTGLGAIKEGDEVVGLNRALFFAGARNIVSSLWEVDDEATTFFMMRFYGELVTNPPHVALQKATLDTQKKYPEPYYWAAFVLAGGQ